jgi:predicted negative regulator of RcsB-dependent stress response
MPPGGPLVRGLLCAMILALGGCALHRQRPATELPKIRVQDLHYGDVLFHVYAGEQFEALTRLEAYEQWGRMPHNEHDALMQAGSLYLQLGMHNEAAARFERLLTPDVPAPIRDRAWYYLAKVWYQRGYYDKSADALGRVSGKLAPELEAEREHLAVNVLMRQGRFEEAAARLRNWQGPPDWMAYARFNLGVALVRQNRVAEAEPFLTAVGTLYTESSELLALRDKANLALGYAWLQARNPAAALVALNRVRLTGPYTTRALLGAGWAHAQLGQYDQALVPWMSLHQRNLLDAAVQESYLAVPYAFGQLGAAAQASEYYEMAMRSFKAESADIDAAIGEIGNGHMLEQLLKGDKTLGPDSFWQLGDRSLPGLPQSRYFYAVLADNDFQEGLKNYRDLAFLGDVLHRWDDSMEAFGAMIATREQAYAERLPRADALLASDRPTQLLARRAAVDGELTAVETGGDAPALGTSEQRKQWARVRELEEGYAAAGDDPQTAEDRDKVRLIKGVLLWQLDQQFRERDYQLRRQLRAVDRALNQAQNRWVRVQKARASVPQNTGEFAARIQALQARIDALRGRLGQAATLQGGYLEQLAEQELVAQQQRLAAYQVQARFALADIYDRAATPPAGAAAPGTQQPPAQSATPPPAAAEAPP